MKQSTRPLLEQARVAYSLMAGVSAAVSAIVAGSGALLAQAANFLLQTDINRGFAAAAGSVAAAIVVDRGFYHRAADVPPRLACGAGSALVLVTSLLLAFSGASPKKHAASYAPDRPQARVVTLSRK